MEISYIPRPLAKGIFFPGRGMRFSYRIFNIIELSLIVVVIMKNKYQQRKDVISSFPRRRRRDSYNVYRLVSAIGGLFICGLLVIIGAQYLQQIRTKQELADFETRILENEARQVSIEAELDRLQDPDYIEIMARERLGLVKPGEIIFQLED